MKNKKIRCTIVLALLLGLVLTPTIALAGDKDTLKEPAGLTAAEYEELMPEALKGYGGQIYDAERKYVINGIFLLAVIRLESANGESRLAQHKNNVAGLKNGSGYMSFEVLSDGIDYAAKNLGENYLEEEGKFYVDGTLSGIESVYCPGGGWAGQIKSIMDECGLEP